MDVRERQRHQKEVVVEVVEEGEVVVVLVDYHL